MTYEEEIAELQRLSAKFRPEQKGDLVGIRVSSQQLTSEYAKADPIFASKTRRLPECYPEYRKIRGDGNCGFRAIAFGYFEALVRLANPAKIRAEAKRLTSLNKLLDDTGQEAFMYEDWVDTTLSLLEQTASISSSQVKESTLLRAFNDSETANSITQHFRMVTSAWMKLNPDDYAPFVPDLDVASYCQNHVDPFYEEIEHVGVKALVDSIINPAGIAVEYLYLDRSAGDQATPYSFPVHDGKGEEVSEVHTVRLLYRPGHYDLLYKQEDLAGLTPATEAEASNSEETFIVVRTLQSIPEPQFLDNNVNFDGLPAFDPYVSFDPSPTFQYEDYSTAGLSVYSEAFDSEDLQSHQPYCYFENGEPFILPDLTSAYFPCATAEDTPVPSQTEFSLCTVPECISTPAAIPLRQPIANPSPEPEPEPEAKYEQKNTSDQLNWSPKTQEQCEYDERWADKSRCTSRDSPNAQTTLLSGEPSPQINAAAHFKQNPLTFRPKMYDGQRDKFIG